MRRFAYRLALHLGYVNVGLMLRSITYEELLEWYNYAQLEPFGEIREDYRNAHVVSTLININRDPKRSKPVKMEDCLLLFGDTPKPKRKQSWQEQKSVAKLWAALYSE